MASIASVMLGGKTQKQNNVISPTQDARTAQTPLGTSTAVLPDFGSYVSLGRTREQVQRPLEKMGYHFEQVDIQVDKDREYPILRASDADAEVDIVGTDAEIVLVSVLFYLPATPKQERNALLTAYKLFTVTAPDWTDSKAWIDQRVATARETHSHYRAELPLGPNRVATAQGTRLGDQVAVALAIEGYVPPVESARVPKAEVPRPMPSQAIATLEAPASMPTTASVAAIMREGSWSWMPITRADLGDDWPLIVEAGILGCDISHGLKDIVIVVDGVTYAVNGAARGRKDGGRKIYEEIEPIWAPHPTIEGLKKDIGPLINKGLQLCP